MCRSTQRRLVRSPVCGFTAIEMMIAVAIVGILVAIALPVYERYVERTRVFKAVIDIGGIATLVGKYAHENDALPLTLADAGADTLRDPWGNPYQYVNHDTTPRGRWRKDKSIVPINTDFDVFSMGKDGLSVPPLTAKPSRDDIVRANNGRFIGLASEYDP